MGDNCLSQVLGVTRHREFPVLLDDSCNPRMGWDQCTDPVAAAFHPFVKPVSYRECLDTSESVTPVATRGASDHDEPVAKPQEPSFLQSVKMIGAKIRQLP